MRATRYTFDENASIYSANPFYVLLKFRSRAYYFLFSPRQQHDNGEPLTLACRPAVAATASSMTAG